MGLESTSTCHAHYETRVINELPVEVATDRDTFLNKYGEKYFLSLYLRVRLIENNMEEKFDDYNKHLIDYYNIGGMIQLPPGESPIALALEYIDRKTINTKIYKTKDLSNPYYFNA